MLDQDTELLYFLRAQQQSENIINKLWGPLCTAALNTLPENASANIFIHILKLSFTGKRKNSDLLIPITDLGNTIPASAHQYIEKHSGKVSTPSVQVAGAQTFPIQVPSVLQSLLSLQKEPSGQFAPQLPPQSVDASSPFATLSSQVGS